MSHTFKELIGVEVECGNHFATPCTSPSVTQQCTAAELLHRTYESHLSRRNGATSLEAGLDEFSTQRFRFYLNHGHAKISSSLTMNACDLVLWQRRAERLVRHCRRLAETEGGRQLCVHYANTNRTGTAWGFHLNVLVPRHVFNAWRDSKWQLLFPQWVPYAVTSQVLFGTGKVGSENNRPVAGYQLSQRVDFVDRLVGDDTVLSKPLIDTRDEPLADPSRFARFHIAAVYDYNCCEFASWLKFSVTQVMLAMIQMGLELPDLRLKYPLTCLTDVSRDETLSIQLELATGQTLSALDIQETLASVAERAVMNGDLPDSVVPSAQQIVTLWMDTIQGLRSNSPQLRRRLDWVTKKHLLEQYRTSRGIPWDDPRLTRLDLHYAETDGGWFERLEQEHLVDRLDDFLPHRTRLCRTESTIRDVARARILRKFRKDIRGVDWNYVDVSVPDGVKSRDCRILLDDPLENSNIVSRIEASTTIGHLIDLLADRNTGR